MQRIRSFRSCGINFSNALPFSRTLQFYFFHCQRHSANTFQFLILTHLLPRVYDPTTTFSQGPGGIIQGSSGGAGPSGTQVSILAHHCILHFKLPPSLYKHISIFNIYSAAAVFELLLVHTRCMPGCVDHPHQGAQDLQEQRQEQRYQFQLTTAFCI